MNLDLEVRRQLTNLLLVRQAHMSHEDAIADFPIAHINSRVPNVGYSFWHLLEHLRLTQYDILDYIRNPGYQEREWPKEYWPDISAETDEAGWERTISQFQADRQALVDIVNDPATDLYAPIPHGWDGHNIIREVLIVGDHNAYHIGELGILRGMLELWPADRSGI
jgi:hypothetical protein